MTVSRRNFLAGSALAAAFGPRLASAQAVHPTTWYNWSGHLSCQPAGRYSPGSSSELAEFLRTTSGPVRPVGAGHSFSPLVPTDGHLIVLDRLTGLTGHDARMMQATFGAGTRLGDTGELLESAGQAMFNLPDIDRQTLAGAISTATHGTGIGFQCLSGYVEALELVTAGGEVMEVTRDDTALFDASRVSLGVLGVITSVTFQNRTPYRLKAQNWVQKTEEVLEEFDERAANHRHFEMFPLTHSDYALVLAIDETDEAVNNPPPDPEAEAAFGQAMAYWATLPPKERKPLIDGMAATIEPTSAVDVSHRILTNVRNNRFNEMEYSVPLEAGGECLREILRTIIEAEVDVVFPLEYRYVKRDDTWLGMSSGDEDHAAISIHRTAGADYQPYFELMEPIFLKYGGRPHWGKVHTLKAEQLRSLYPRFDEFSDLRATMDPENRFLNDHLKSVFLG